MNIKELRMKTKLSQTQFAARYEIPVRTIQQWEQRKSLPPDYVIKLLAYRIQQEEQTASNDYVSQYRLKEIPQWKQCIQEGFANCVKIHPLQQKKVKFLIDDLSQCKSISKLIIFGSSVTNQCHIGSDIDLYAQMDCDTNPLSKNYPFQVDFWNNFRVDERLFSEIIKKGVVVYVR